VHIVAIDYAPEDAERLAEPLAYALDRTLFEARSRLSDPLGGPTVVGSFSEETGATICSRHLRDGGIAVTILTSREVETEGARFAVRGFRLDARELVVTARHGRELAVPYGDIELLVRGTLFTPRAEMQVVEQRRFSPTRTLLSGGLIMTKKTRTVRPIAMEEREGFLQVYARGAEEPPPLVFREAGLNYQALGPDLQPSTGANFAHFIELLRQRAPQARYDERLIDKPGRARVLGPSLSTDRHLDVALTLLARVLRNRPRREPAVR
jgi:hypothetical protein